MASDESVAIHRLAGELRSLTIEVEQLHETLAELRLEVERLRTTVQRLVSGEGMRP
jgi:hypothetical protein